MAYEVEMKFRALSDWSSTMADLERQGAKDLGEFDHSDMYFRHPCRDFVETNEAFRIRRENRENALTYKGPRLPGLTKTREEIEIGFLEGEGAWLSMATLLDRLGFQAVAEVRKVRRVFGLRFEGREMHAAFDRAEEIGDFVEVEAIASDQSDLESARDAVLKLAKALGLEDLEPRSYLRMLLEKRAQI